MTPTCPTCGAPLALAPPPTPAPVEVALPVDHPRPRSTQRVLLALGVLLVVVAGLVFVAVAWRTLGVGGQVAVVAGAAAATGLASRLLERRTLTASAEATAVLATGLLAVGLGAARELGLGGLEAVGGFAYAAVVATLLASLCVLAGYASTSRAWGVLAVVAASAAVPLGLRAADPGWFAYALAFALAAVAAHGLGRVLPSRVLVRRPGRVAAVAFAVLTWGVAPLAAWGDRSPQAPACAAVGLALAVLVLVALPRRGGSARPWTAHAGLALLTPLAAAAQLAAACSLLPGPARAGAAVLAVAVLVAAAHGASGSRRSWTGVVAVAAGATATLVSLDLLVDLHDATTVTDLPVLLVRDATWWSVLAALLALVVGGLLVARRQPRHGEPAAALVAAALLVGTTVAASTTTLAVLVGGLAALGTLLAVGARRSPGGEEVVLVAGAVVAEVVAFGVAFTAEDLTPAAGVLSTAGVVALAYGFTPGRAWLWWVGAVAVPAGSWLWLLDHGVSVVEAFSLPLAGLCLLAGALGRARRRHLSSWAVAGPAMTAGLVPSALASIGDDGLLRPLLLLAAASALLVVGVHRRWQALVVVPAFAVAVVAVAQLAPWAVGLPRWSSLGAAGVLLLVVGVRYESRRQNVLSAARWVRSLG